MKLYHSPASPYVRKVMVVAIETGQEVDILGSAASPVNRDVTIVAQNPTGKVPTALIDGDQPLYDSRVITQWLAAQQSAVAIYPAGDALWPVLRREALGDGLLDAALLARYETAMRPEALRWEDWLRGQMEKIDSSLDQMNAEVGDFGEVDAGVIAIACALGYLDFRFPDLDWRTSRPALADWFKTFSARPSMQQTRPE
ncbi:MAG: glutathione S-transferase family protein [Pseudomonadota bacterium]|nr:glutathione S-transferase family protein [Pseudomonadota bacterium]